MALVALQIFPHSSSYFSSSFPSFSSFPFLSTSSCLLLHFTPLPPPPFHFLPLSLSGVVRILNCTAIALIYFDFDIGSQQVTQAGLKLNILFQFPKYLVVMCDHAWHNINNKSCSSNLFLIRGRLWYVKVVLGSTKMMLTSLHISIIILG